MPEFEKLTIPQQADYEGPVVCTLLKKCSNINSRKAVLYIHGFNDYFFNSEIAECFTTHGFNFYALDLRKSGRSLLSHQKLNNLRNISEYFDDIRVALKIIAEEGATRVLLYGHSMGGLITALFASLHDTNGLIRAVFLNSPFFELNENWLSKKLLLPVVSFLGKQLPNVPVPGRFSKYYGPSLHVGHHGEWSYNLKWKPHLMPLVNMGWIRAIYLAQNQLKRGLFVNQPTLLMCSAKSVKGRTWKDAFKYGDAILKVEDIITYAECIKGNCEVSIIKDAVHDVMLSIPSVRQTAQRKLFAWLDTVI